MDIYMHAVREFFKNAHIQLALATGVSIILLAYVSKHVLEEPIKNLHLAIAPFIMTIWEAFSGKHKDSKYSRPLYWVIAIAIATILVIAVNAR